jgi:hemin uptake protein HemP
MGIIIIRDYSTRDSETMHPEFTPSPPASCLGAQARPPCAPDTIAGAQLFNGRQEILIDHNGETYRLRITKNGKLILTK